MVHFAFASCHIYSALSFFTLKLGWIILIGSDWNEYIHRFIHTLENLLKKNLNIFFNLIYFYYQLFIDAPQHLIIFFLALFILFLFIWTPGKMKSLVLPDHSLCTSYKFCQVCKFIRTTALKWSSLRFFTERNHVVLLPDSETFSNKMYLWSRV